ncbi:MAG: DsrE family protein [Gammaproteobacteria bacterium]|nr:DsrE family protein [Gammaproteobacteria bacterium]
MADKLLIVMANADLSKPAELLPPLLQATVAAAMEYEVEVLLTGQAGQLAMQGEAEKIVFHEGDCKTYYDHIKQAKNVGVKIKVCTPALKFWGENLIPEIDETVGGAYIINEAMDDSTVTFTY